MQPQFTTSLGGCQCGCGQKTSTITESHPGRGLVKGNSHRFVQGHWAKAHRIPRDLKSLEDRFWQYVQKTKDCWLWVGYKNNKGYGIFEVKGKNVPASHVSWELHYGPISLRRFVLHNCPNGDNPACVRPEHLFLGTHCDNMVDMVAKGRSLKGVRNPRAKLTVDDVRQIRRDRATGVLLRTLAARYGVTISAINQIIRGVSWAWL